MLSPRLSKLPRQRVCGRLIPVATGFRSRLLGLAGLSRAQAGTGLLIPDCAAVHTFGMRFDLDLVFLDGCGRSLSIRHSVPPCRFVCQRGAAAVLEIPAGQGGRVLRSQDLGGGCCPSDKRSPASSSARTTR